MIAIRRLASRPIAVYLGLSVLLLALGVALGTHFALADPPDTRVQLTNLGAAREVLGRDVPQVRLAGQALSLSSVAVDPVANPNRGVHLTYAVERQNVVALSVFRSESIERFGPGDFETINLNGQVAVVSVKSIDTWQAVTYTWSKDGLVHVLHVKLTAGLTRTIADEIAASVG